MIDLTQTGKDARGIPQFAANPGGAPANLAVAASRLGAQTAFIGKVGADAFGRYLKEVLAENKVDVSGMAVDADHPTTMAVVSVDATGERDFSFYRSANADVMLCKEDISDEALKAAKIVHFGSVSLTADPSRTATLDAAARAKKLGAVITYDPNYRANLWKNKEDAIAQMKAPLPLVDILKVSDEELPLLTGTTDCESGTAQLAQNGVRLIFVTLGANGVFYRLWGQDRSCGWRPLQGGRHQRRRRYLLWGCPVQALQGGAGHPDCGQAGKHSGLCQQGSQHHHQSAWCYPRHAHPCGSGGLNHGNKTGICVPVCQAQG